MEFSVYRLIREALKKLTLRQPSDPYLRTLLVRGAQHILIARSALTAICGAGD